MKNILPPPKCNCLNKFVCRLFLILLFTQVVFSCTQEQDLQIPQDELQALRNFIDLELAGQTTFDNLPLEADWNRAMIGEESIEIPLVNPVNGFVSIYDNFQTRIIVAKGKPEAFQIVSLEASFDHSDEMFENIIESQRVQSSVRWMIMDKDLRSLEVDSYRTVSDPKANMPVDCVTLSYFERTCYYSGASLIYCTDWDPVSSTQVYSGGEGEGEVQVGEALIMRKWKS